MDFPVSFVAVFKMLKYLIGPESTPEKERKGSLVLCNIVLDLADSHTVTWDELKNTRNLRKDE